MKRISGKVVACKERLVSEIAAGIFRPGGRLPSERELGQVYKVSRSTVRAALTELEESDIVYRKPPVGTFVSDDALQQINFADTRATKILAFFVLPSEQVDNPFFQRLFLEMKRRMPDGVELVAYPSYSCSGLWDDEKPDIVYLFGDYGEEELQEAAQQGSHLVLWGRPHETINFVSCDEYAGGRLMAETALEAGHRHLALIGPRGTGPGCEFSQRAAGIAEVCRERNIPLQSHRFSLEESFNLTGSTFFALDNFLRVDPKLSMIFALSDRGAVSIMDCCRRRRLRIPDDISVIGYDDQCFVEATRPALTTVRCSAEENAKQLVLFGQTILADRSNKKVDWQKMITPFLVERQSVKIIS